MTAFVVLAGVLLAATLTQVWARLGFGRRVPIGDENEYLARARAEDPFGPVPFLRVPLMTAFARLAGKTRTEVRLRNALSFIAVATVMLVAAAGFVVHGPWGAIACVLLFTLLPDRVILSHHVWPDTLLACGTQACFSS